MKNEKRNIKIINSVTELHKLLGLSKPSHPLITLINHSHERTINQEETPNLVLNFYNIAIKRSFKGQMKYGKKYYDFDEGTMSFVAPNQVIGIDANENSNNNGWSLLIHPNLIRNYPLGKSIKNYGFFSYELYEALHLSEEEERMIENCVQNIKTEYESRMDNFSQDVIVSQLELLLNYCNRFYNRQFITRKMASTDLLAQFEAVLSKHFEDKTETTLPTVQSLAKQLNLSTSYLSDMLRTVTGQNTQQHIHNKILEKAKELLTTTNLTVSEIAYELGFEHSQSFSKLFKNKIGLSPITFRKSYHY